MSNKKAIRVLENIEHYLKTHTNESCEEEHMALNLAIKALEENTALNLLVDWAIQCDFGFDNFPEEYEKYKEDIKGLGYKEGMIYIAKKESRGNV